MRRFAALGIVLTVALTACSSPPRPPCSSAPPLATICGFENPEDAAPIGGGALVVSNLRLRGQGGFLSILAGGEPHRAWPPSGTAPRVSPLAGLGDDDCPPPSAADFAPHGVFASAGTPARVFVINHGGRESIEIFGVDGTAGEAVLTWQACVMLPPNTSANDLAVAADGEIIASNYLPSARAWWGSIKYILGLPTGDLIAWKRDRGWRHVAGTTASAANGVAVSADGRWIYYSETGGGKIDRIPREGGTPQRAAVPGWPDNLSWSDRGTLLLATHMSGLQFIACAFRSPCRSPWRLLEVDPQTLQASTRLDNDGDLLGAVAGAQQLGDTTYLTAVFGDRIGVIRK